MGAVEGVVPKWGGGGQEQPGDIDMGEVLFGGGQKEITKETEWEVGLSERFN